MKSVINRHLLLLSIVAVILCGCGDSSGTAEENSNETGEAKLAALPASAVSNALPFTIEFVEKNYAIQPALPRLQSYSFGITKDGYFLIIGGRRQGLHTFEPKPATNFIPDSSNNYIYVINPANGQSWYFDVNQLPGILSAPLQSTNQQHCYDAAAGQMYIVGGYGWDSAKTNMQTFNTIIRFKVDDLANAITTGQSASQVAALFEWSHDDRFAVTGGELLLFNANFYLVFGQRFDGQYRAFGGNDFTQKYTEEVRVFNLIPNSLKIRSYGATTNTTADHPFHRRDGNIIADIDPKTGQLRIASFGGVFKPGIIAPYTYPVYIYGPGTPVVDTSGQQKFSQYSCPVITVYDSSSANPTVYHTFFGGIGHYYYAQTDSQKIVYNIATQQGRNDGFPFVEDVTTFLQSADGTYNEYIHPDPIPGSRLLGASIPFIVNRALITNGVAYSNGVIRLSQVTSGTKLLVGYIYGGIEAQNPLPIVPNTGTFVSNSVFEVYVTNTPSAGIPATEGHESTKSDANLHRE